MILARRTLLISLLGLVLTLTGSTARAGQIWDVSIDTSQMASDYTGPFALDFELVGTNGNTVTLSQFSFGTGSAGPGSAFLTGGASGSLAATVTLNDSVNFFSDFNQQFTPGATLTFTMDSTLIAPPVGGSPDNFSMVIFSNYDPVHGYNPITGTGGTPIPTTDPSGNDTFFNFNITGPGTTVSAFPSASGDISITVTPQSVPEPPSAVLWVLGVAGSGAFWRYGTAQKHRRVGGGRPPRRACSCVARRFRIY
jgi:hypothetical protein